MFTGLVEEIGVLTNISKGDKSYLLTFQGKKIMDDIQIGDSISVNGVCLTANSITKTTFSAEVMPETLKRSSLGALKIGNEVNLERAMSMNGRFGGHIVSGHIDGTGKIDSIEKENNAVVISIRSSLKILRYIIEKGSITIDGISLTVIYVDNEIFKVSLIPHTGNETTLLKKSVGSKVNLECDMVGKYIEKLLQPMEEKKEKSNINLDFLTEHGFY
ncbi:riboflavin synthase alpha chain [Mobilisporobacter senegalensis]|uniref:Riboflavin synthase n=1 Tax=Mobilisporobacter senegalensis TaxID=1329262 RepID=A0A3N1XWB8_9FIRM|nr:riboflavin synthase [Mobilisporobacter senegalensis]ROR30501.1 riboflavin synthase alpha chain [Mobilisporobacter senegalensis]